jgi:hypothetical protein
MSFITKLREFLGIRPRKKTARRSRRPNLGSDKPNPPDDTEGSAGVTAKLQPLPPTLSGANARAFPPED